MRIMGSLLSYDASSSARVPDWLWPGHQEPSSARGEIAEGGSQLGMLGWDARVLRQQRAGFLSVRSKRTRTAARPPLPPGAVRIVLEISLLRYNSAGGSRGARRQHKDWRRDIPSSPCGHSLTPLSDEHLSEVTPPCPQTNSNLTPS